MTMGALAKGSGHSGGRWSGSGHANSSSHSVRGHTTKTESTSNQAGQSIPITPSWTTTPKKVTSLHTPARKAARTKRCEGSCFGSCLFSLSTVADAGIFSPATPHWWFYAAVKAVHIKLAISFITTREFLCAEEASSRHLGHSFGRLFHRHDQQIGRINYQ